MSENTSTDMYELHATQGDAELIDLMQIKETEMATPERHYSNTHFLQSIGRRILQREAELGMVPGIYPNPDDIGAKDPRP